MTDEFTRTFFKHYIAKTIKQAPISREKISKNASTAHEKPQIEKISSVALDVLADVIINFVQNLACETVRYTQHAGRTESNGADVLKALAEYRETTTTLETFISDNSVVSDGSIQPYPLAQKSIFMDRSERKDEFFPFRLHSLVSQETSQSESHLIHIPGFLTPFDESQFSEASEAESKESIPDEFQAEEAPKPTPSRICVNAPLTEEIVKSILGSSA